MRLLTLSAALFICGAAAAQTPPSAGTAPAAPAPGGDATEAAPLNGDSPIDSIVATPAGKASMEKNMPEVLAHQGFEQFKKLSLRALLPLSAGLITDEKIAALEADLKAAR